MKYLLLFILLSSAVHGAKAEEKKGVVTIQDQEAFEKKRWDHIYGLINEEINTINMVRKKSQKLMYRLFELKSEKIKLFKEKENKEFMAKKRKFGKKIKRKDIFKQTIRLYQEANKYGHNLLRKYPNTHYKAAIYYTLALNSRDFAYDDKELGYLKKAIKYSQHQQKVRYLATVSLAEYYYNNKKYKQAVTEYEKIIDNRDDEWLTKNLYNYGWCLLKTHKFDAAINRLEDSYKSSENEFYVDMSEQVMSSLVSFYVYGKQIDRGIAFINKHAYDKVESLFKLAQKASGKGYYADAQKIIEDLEDRIDSKQKVELYADLRLFQFDFYKQYHKEEKLLRIAKMFPALTFNEYQKEDAIRKVSEVVGTKQIILKKDFSKHDQQYDKSVLDQIITYFNILASVNKPEKAQYEYYKGETYYSVHRFKSALDSYKISLMDYDKTPSKEDLRAQNMDAIFSCIDIIKFSEKEKRDELEFAFNKYLSYWPKNDKAQDIYPRLYALYAKTKTYPKMQESIDRYIAAFPKDGKKQQDLYRTQLDFLIKDKNTQLLSSKVNQMKKGYLSFEASEVKKSEEILASILFNKYQEFNKAGKQEQALAGYQEIHFTDFYPQSIRAEAAFNMGMIYTDMRDNNNAIKWYQKSFDFYTDKERANKRTFLEKMALRTALLQDFLYAAKLNKFILQNYCSEKKANEKIFSAAIKNDLANDYITKVFYTLEKQSHCVTRIPLDLKKEIMVHLYENKHESSLMSFIDDYKMKDKFTEEVAHYYERLFWQYYLDNPGKEKQYFYELKTLKYEKKSKLLVKAMDKLEKLDKKLKYYQRDHIYTADMKNPEKFSGLLQKRIQKLQPLITEANEIFELGHGQVSVLVYDRLTALTASLADEIESYRLPIKDAEFQKQFVHQMKLVAKNFNQQSMEFKLSSQKLIEEYDLILAKRDESHLAHDILKISDIRPLPAELAITFGLGRP
ncbi:MAG: hypothetical protein CME62_09110 [Halobacteriovoraceae bacterium]|nr:hypothetical protein [Halobacteriovoraceae bacterium]|tara:strand:+ start:5076 stop:7958 length:2883 start_codon:yes stop_codon:yes gene_type:complete